MAMRLYARQAKNRQLEGDAYEIRLRAERRVGEMMDAQPKAQGAREPGTNRGATRDIEKPASYSDAGIDKNLANRARKLHACRRTNSNASSRKVAKPSNAAWSGKFCAQARPPGYPESPIFFPVLDYPDESPT
jgi:hypothetical protein